MTAREAALAHLELWLGEARDPDDEQRPWKQAFGRGAVLAYERVGVLAAGEAARWRERLADPEAPVRADARLRAAAERYLESVDGDAAAAEALVEVGALDDAGSRRRRGDAPSGWTAYADLDADPDASDDPLGAWEEPGEARRVAVGSPERKDDLAVVAVVVHERAVSLHFHSLGPQQATDPPLEAFGEMVDALEAPDLRDDAGTAYEPVARAPISAQGAGGLPDPERRQAVSGQWLYTPTAPDAARTFTATSGGRTWELSG